jgi:transcriptional regulator with GAF, ATPase, and Fis domain
MEEKTMQFYQEAILRICGNLDIQSAMSETLKLFKEYMPVDVMYLQIYEHQLRSMRSIAEAMVSHHRLTDILIPLPEQAFEAMTSWKPAQLPDVQISNRGEGGIIKKILLKAHGIQDASIMVLPLLLKKGDLYVPYIRLKPSELKERITEGQGLASIVMVSKGGELYGPKEAALFSSLREPFSIAVSNALQHRELERINLSLKQDNIYLNQELKKRYSGKVIGSEGGLKETMDMIHRIGPTSATVLLLGETGVGKEVLAQEIHRLSEAAAGPFVAVNCGAIPEGIVESELFGHEKGSFTGAAALKKGYFERADCGTLFLDEIGELPENAQIKLLRVIQSRKIIRVGGSKEISTDFRLIAATNRDLNTDVKSGRFREDLWYRINVFPLEIKPLRDRKEDIPLLADFLIRKKQVEMNIPFRPVLGVDALDHLVSYQWPGNVRELENVIERSLILSGGEELTFSNLGSERVKTFGESDADISSNIRTIDEVLKRHIVEVLRITGGKIHGSGGAAEVLGINPNTLRNRMNRLGIDYKK